MTLKKLYTKPEITFEDFTLNTSIAGDCDVKTNTPSQNACPYIKVIAGTERALFTTEIEGCVYTQGVADGQYNGLCYHVPTENNNLFNS